MAHHIPPHRASSSRVTPFGDGDGWVKIWSPGSPCSEGAGRGISPTAIPVSLRDHPLQSPALFFERATKWFPSHFHRGLRRRFCPGWQCWTMRVLRGSALAPALLRTMCWNSVGLIVLSLSGDCEASLKDQWISAVLRSFVNGERKDQGPMNRSLDCSKFSLKDFIQATVCSWRIPHVSHSQIPGKHLPRSSKYATSLPNLGCFYG